MLRIVIANALRRAPLGAAGRLASVAVVAAAALTATLTLPACRTTEGAGRDVQALGDNIADSAHRNRP